jgi:predicted RNase H-like nuclease
MEMAIVAGVDGCSAGWVVAILPAGRAPGRPGYFLVGRFEDVLALEAELVCVDIPIGLGLERTCDREARARLGAKRGSSVFPAPSRALISAYAEGVEVPYERANAISMKASGKKISRQCHAICPKIAEVDRIMNPELQRRVREVHPELCFASLKGAPLESAKRSEAGRRERIRLLSGFVSLGEESRLPKLPGSQPDDLVDALVAALTAREAAGGGVEVLPKHPPVDARGLRMEMLTPLRRTS